MWQSHLQIKDYSVMYFDHVATFQAPYHRTFVKGRASCIYETHMSPTLDGSLMVRHLEHSDAIEIHNGIIFNFYTYTLAVKYVIPYKI